MEGVAAHVCEQAVQQGRARNRMTDRPTMLWFLVGCHLLSVGYTLAMVSGSFYDSFVSTLLRPVDEACGASGFSDEILAERRTFISTSYYLIDSNALLSNQYISFIFWQDTCTVLPAINTTIIMILDCCEQHIRRSSHDPSQEANVFSERSSNATCSFCFEHVVDTVSLNENTSVSTGLPKHVRWRYWKAWPWTGGTCDWPLIKAHQIWSRAEAFLGIVADIVSLPYAAAICKICCLVCLRKEATWMPACMQLHAASTSTDGLWWFYGEPWLCSSPRQRCI